MTSLRFYKTPDNERRAYFRIPFEMVVSCQACESNSLQTQGEDIFIPCRDISVGGLLLQSPESFDNGTIVKLEIPIPGRQDTLHIYAEVLRTVEGEGDRKEMALQFKNINAGDRESIAALVNYYRRNTDLPL